MREKGGKMTIDDEFLKEVGLSVMPEEQKRAFLEYVEGEIEVRIGERISEGIPVKKLREFEKLGDEEALAWLKENKPNFIEIVDEVIAEMKAEISRNRDKILQA